MGFAGLAAGLGCRGWRVVEATRRGFLAAVCAPLAAPAAKASAVSEEETLRRLLWTADWSRSFSLAFTDRDGNRRVLEWLRWNDRFALLGTDEPPAPDEYWPPVCKNVYYRHIADDWPDAVGDVWWHHFGEEWTWGVPPSLEASSEPPGKPGGSLAEVRRG